MKSIFNLKMAVLSAVMFSTISIANIQEPNSPSLLYGQSKEVNDANSPRKNVSNRKPNSVFCLQTRALVGAVRAAVVEALVPSYQSSTALKLSEEGLKN